MQSEFQPYVIGYCYKCGAEAIFCIDWNHLEWNDPEPDCLCALNKIEDKDGKGMATTSEL